MPDMFFLEKLDLAFEYLTTDSVDILVVKTLGIDGFPSCFKLEPG